MTSADQLRVGQEIELELGEPGHGGISVARYDGRVVFVRFGATGERVLVRLTEVKSGSFCRGDVVAVRERSIHRATAPCLHYGPGGCGGCDLMHLTGEGQRRWKAQVVADQLRRLAGIERDVTVTALPGDGFGWRTRVRWAVETGGGGSARIGPRASRSHSVIPVSAAEPCLIAAPGLTEAAGKLHLDRQRPVARRGRGRGPSSEPEVVLVRDPQTAEPVVVLPGEQAPVLVETVLGNNFRVAADGFWQVHPAAAGTLASTVRDQIAGHLPTGGTGWDLYGGVGLFAAVMAELAGPDSTIVTIEGDRQASGFARENLGDSAVVRCGDVAEALRELPGPVDVVVLDPPRSGAGRAVCDALAAADPTCIVYVACDPAALGRDTKTLLDHGYQLTDLKAFDCFPQTHHVECVATFLRP